MIIGYVAGQELRLSSPVIVADSVRYLAARFLFRQSEWDGLTEVRAVFSRKGGAESYSILLTDCEVLPEDNLNLAEGVWLVHLVGSQYAGGELVQRITTEDAELTVKPCKAVGGGVLPDVPITEAERLTARVEAMKESVGGVVDMFNAIEKTLGALVDRSITDISMDVVRIGDYTFRDCVSLETAVFPDAVEVGYRAFYGCLVLKGIYFPSAETFGNYTFEMCNELPHAFLPMANAVSSYMFQDCWSLEWVDLPKAASIGTYAFNRCYSLKRIILRSETVVTVANSNAFTKCYHLLGTVNADYNPDGAKDCYIYVPAALIEEYKAANIWKTHAAQFRALEDYTIDGTVDGPLEEIKI